MYQIGGALSGYGLNKAYDWKIPNDVKQWHGVCHAHDKMVQVQNAQGKWTAARAKVVKFVVCKEQCNPGDTSCTLPAKCATKKTVNKCRIARCKVPYADGKCPSRMLPTTGGVPGGEDWTHNLDWDNVDTCTKYAATAITMMA